jgi:hypothetical protein
MLTLELADEELDELFAGRRPAGPVKLPEGLELTLSELSAAPCELRLTRGDRSGYGWVGAEQAALAVPAGPAGRTRLHVVPTDFVPDALARLNGIEPRPAELPPSPIRFTPGELAQAVASGGNDTTAAVREHWRVEAAWAVADGEPVVHFVEVLDTARGMWLIVPVQDQLELRPSRAAEVFVLLCGLVRGPAG